MTKREIVVGHYLESRDQGKAASKHKDPTSSTSTRKEVEFDLKINLTKMFVD
jgi:hypothetical protein